MHEAMFNYKSTQSSFYDTTKLAIHCIWLLEVDSNPNCGDKFKKTVSFDGMVHLIHQSIVNYVNFDSGLTFYTEHVNRELKNICSSCENPKCIPNNDQHNCFIEELTTDISVDPCS